MANALVFLSDLHPGRSSSTVQVRLLRLWESWSVRRGGDYIGVNMLLLDSQATMMPANVSLNRLATHQPNLKAGSVYSLTNFDVTCCDRDCRLSDSSLLIRLSDSTSFNESIEPAVPIPQEPYWEITGVKSTVTDPPQDKNRVMATIKMENDASVTISLFEAQAVKIHNQLKKMGGDPKVVVITSVNPRMVGGRLYLNATSGTHIYFHNETDAGEIFLNRLVAQDTGLAPVAPLLKTYAKVETLSIAELNDFVITAPSQDIDFICSGKVTGIKMDNGWCYVSCSKCCRKLQRSVSSFTCVPCNDTNAIAVIRYRVEMSIADETGEGLFVGFDGVMAKLHNMRAYEAVHLVGGDGVNPEETDAPPFVKDIARGKTYRFQGGGDDDNADDNHPAVLVRGKVDVCGGCKPEGPSAKVKKARKA
uniref:Replication factor A C-terminal domain-containing protein n=1 Tax=Brassica oleracea var. oleracea TaxID=109376 RepID=A0A0D2ZR01_BRAOL